jgi:hypothetical protein
MLYILVITFIEFILDSIVGRLRKDAVAARTFYDGYSAVRTTYVTYASSLSTRSTSVSTRTTLFRR